jgi:hypothetical protein
MFIDILDHFIAICYVVLMNFLQIGILPIYYIGRNHICSCVILSKNIFFMLIYIYIYIIYYNMCLFDNMHNIIIYLFIKPWQLWSLSVREETVEEHELETHLCMWDIGLSLKIQWSPSTFQWLWPDITLHIAHNIHYIIIYD